MEKAKEIQEAISSAEDLIKKTVDGLIARGIQVDKINIEEVLADRQTVIDLRTHRIRLDDRDLTKENSTLDEWIDQLHVECAYANISVDICGGIEEWTEAYNEGGIPMDYLQDNIDAA